MPLPSLDEIQSIRVPAQQALVGMYEKNQDASNAEAKYKNYLRLVFNKSNEEVDALIATLKSGASNTATQNAAAEKERMEAERLRLQQDAADKARLEAERLQQEADARLLALKSKEEADAKRRVDLARMHISEASGIISGLQDELNQQAQQLDQIIRNIEEKKKRLENGQRT